jgi:hypothetical protein
MSKFYIVDSDMCRQTTIQKINHYYLSMAALSILYAVDSGICSSQYERNWLVRFRGNDGYANVLQCYVVHILQSCLVTTPCTMVYIGYQRFAEMSWPKFSESGFSQIVGTYVPNKWRHIQNLVIWRPSGCCRTKLWGRSMYLTINPSVWFIFEYWSLALTKKKLWFFFKEKRRRLTLIDFIVYQQKYATCGVLTGRRDYCLASGHVLYRQTAWYNVIPRRVRVTIFAVKKQ